MPGLIALVAALGAAAVCGLLSRRARLRGLRPLATTTSALTETDLGAALGERATLVQFSTAFCAPCRGTRQVLARVADTTDGVSHVEIDATSRMDLVRRLNVISTPTVLVLGPDGAVARRGTGLPRIADVVAAVSAVTAGERVELSPIPVDNAKYAAYLGSDSEAAHE